MTNDSGAGSGGGIINGGDVTISNSTLSDNTALAGGAIANFGGSVTITNSTLSGNVATDGGSFNGGGIINFDTDDGFGDMKLRATIVANSPSGGDCSGGYIEDDGYNIDDDGTCRFTGTSISDSSTLDGTLGPLANNGGPTETIALLTSSPALAQVPAPDCPATDQRGDARGVPCDIGAYEAGQVSPQAIAFTSIIPTNAAVSGSPYTVTATGGASGNPVLFTAGALSTGVCSLDGAVVSFIGVGTCTIDANQAGSTGYAAAPEVQQSFDVGPGTPTTPTITNIPGPGTVLVGGSFLPVVSTTGDGTMSVSSSTTPVCRASANTVDYVVVGTCTLTAHVTAGTNYTAADGSPQSFTINPQPQAIVSSNSATATVGSLFSFTVMTTGAPVPSISKEGMLPRHLAFANNGDGTAAIGGLPRKAGIYRFFVRATFGTGRTKHVVIQPFTLTVDPG